MKSRFAAFKWLGIMLCFPLLLTACGGSSSVPDATSQSLVGHWMSQTDFGLDSGGINLGDCQSTAEYIISWDGSALRADLYISLLGAEASTTFCHAQLGQSIFSGASNDASNGTSAISVAAGNNVTINIQQTDTSGTEQYRYRFIFTGTLSVDGTRLDGEIHGAQDVGASVSTNWYNLDTATFMKS